MRRSRIMIAVGTATALAMAGAAGAAVLKGAGKASLSIIKTSGGHGNNASDAKPAGTLSAKPAPAKAGLAPTGGASFALKLAKDLGDPTKPGFADGDYVVDVESSPTPDGDIVGNGLAAEFFITLTITAGKCTIHGNPHFSTGGDMCGGTGQPLCASDLVGKCTGSIYQVAGTQLNGIDLPGDPFFGRFRIRTNPTPASCSTGDLCLGVGGCSPASTTCKSGSVVGVGGVALAPFGF
jgi:hypothetical protein